MMIIKLFYFDLSGKKIVKKVQDKNFFSNNSSGRSGSARSGSDSKIAASTSLVVIPFWKQSDT